MDHAVSKAPRLERLWTLWIGVTIILTPAAINLATAEMAGVAQEPWLVEVLSVYDDVKMQTTTGLVLLGLALIARGVFRLLARQAPSAPVDLTLLHLQGAEAPVPLVTTRYLPRPTGPSGTVRFPFLPRDEDVLAAAPFGSERSPA